MRNWNWPLVLPSPENTFWTGRIRVRLQGRNLLDSYARYDNNIIFDSGNLCHRRLYLRLLIRCTEEAENRRCTQKSSSGFCGCTSGLILHLPFTGAALIFLFARGSFSITPVSANDRPLARFLFQHQTDLRTHCRKQQRT